ncbi:hypothetical protein [Jiulongibacter sediminis]|uniref:DUF7507 domain-containing protein n=1 Tax=Jiulongibacter sediminis TaxID=1605367 RepID=UPI0026F2285F|nr:hypothetical protein [Jiulongibacter sediminis]
MSFQKRPLHNTFLLTLLGLFLTLFSIDTSAQCVIGSNNADNKHTWQNAGEGPETVINSFGTPGGPPSTISDFMTVCTPEGSVINVPFTIQISEVNGNVYDRMRSSTNGGYGQPYFTLFMDNFDGGCTTCDASNNAAYAPGSRIDVLYTFTYPVIISNLEVSDIDGSDTSNPPAGSSSFQDRVTFSATNASNANAPLNVVVGKPGLITLSGTNNQTATSNWGAGQNYNIEPDSLQGAVFVSSTQAIKTLRISYIAGPNEPNPAQQAIRIGEIENVCCPTLPIVSGNIFDDCDGLDDNTVDGPNAAFSANTLFINVIDVSTNTIVAVAPVQASGTYEAVVPSNDTYSLSLSTTPGTLGSSPPAASLPAGYTNTGENLGSGTGSDGVVNGILTNVVVGTSDIANANFGVQGPIDYSITATSNGTVCFGDDINLSGNLPDGVLREAFYGISGTSISNLTSSSNYPDFPDEREVNTSAIGPLNIADDYGTRVRYYFTPTVSGNYQFVIYGDDNTALYWSGSESSSPLSTIASIPDYTAQNELTKYASQQTSVLSLTAGQEYYFELLQKEGGGDDHYGILWKPPGSGTYSNIPAANLSYMNASWTGPNGFSSSTISSTISGATTAASGIYTLTATNLFGCAFTATVEVIVDNPVLSTTQSNVICNGGSTGSINLTVSGPASSHSYSWSNGATTEDISGLTAGTYSVTVTSNNGCIATTSVTITEPAAVVPSVTPTAALCNGANGSASLSAIGGNGSYTFTSSGGTVSGNTLTSPAGTYTITATDGNGCTGTTSVTITEPAAVAPSASPTAALCNGANGSASLSAIGGNGSYTFTSTGGTVSGNNLTAPAGTYTITATDGNGCTGTTTVTITEPVAVAPSASPTAALCNGDNGSASLSAIGGNGSYTFTSTGGTVSGNSLTAPAGTYTITAIDGNGCTGTTSVTITEPAAVAPSATPTAALCNGANGSASLSAIGGNGSYTFTSSGGTVSGNTLTAPAGTYTIIATDGNGCVGTTTVTIAEPAAAAPSATPTAALCNGANGSASLSAVGGNGSYTFTSSGGTVSGNTLTAPAGTYTITATDGNGCTGTTAVTITEPAAVTPSATPTAALCNGANGSASLSAVGGNGSYTFTSSGGTVSGNTLTAPAGTYTITATDGNGCTGTTAVTITEPAVVAPSATPTAALCNGANGSASLSATGGNGSYTFTSSGGTVSGNTLTAPAGTYTITATDGNGCTGTTTVTITEPATVVPSATPTAALCNGANGSASLSAVGGNGSYTFTSSGGTVSGNTLTAPAGTYTITATDGNGCIGTTTVTITEPATYVTASADDYILGCFETTGTIVLTVADGTSPYTFDWDNDGTGDFDDSQNLTNVPEGTYNVTVRDANGCETTASADVIFTACPDLTITKDVDLSTISSPENLTYTITVNNTGNVSLSNINLTDDLAGVATLSSGDINTNTLLDTNEVWVYTASYSATQSDIDAGTDLINTASVTTTELPTPESDTATTAITQAPSLTIEKTQTGGESPITTPGTIDYTIVITNDGNQSLTGVVVSDTLPNGTVGALSAVTESISANGILDTTETWTYTISYNVTQADIDAGTDLVNVAVVTTTELPTPESDTAATAITQSPSLTIVKTQTGGESPITTPGTIDYTIVITNDGNQSLTGLVVSDTLPNGTVGTLSAVTESISANGILDTTETWTYTISYAVTQADIDAGTDLVNVAVVTTTELPTPESDTAATPITQNPSLTITKTQTGGESPITNPGSIDYTIVVTNDGNQSLTGVVVSDTLPNGTVGTLSAVTESISANNVLDTNETWTYTISYAVTQADIDAGTDLVNVAVVTTTELPTPESDTAATAITQTPSLTIVKTQTGGESPITNPGTIDYTIVVTNDGNQSLTGVVVSDTLPNGTVGTLSGPVGSITADGVLSVVEAWTYTISYAVTQADIDAGTDLVNVAVVTTTELPTPESDTAATTITQTPSLIIVKTQTGGESPITTPGTIDYTIVITNDGNQSLTGVVVSDTLPNGTVGTLSAVTESINANGILDTTETWTYTISYAVTQADIDAGTDLVNVAVVTTTELPTPESDTAATAITQTSSLTIVKTQTGGESPITTPGTIDYTIVITNDGNQSLTGVVVRDTLPNGTVGTLSAETESISANGILDTTETWTYTISYDVTQADIDAGVDLVNVAVVTTTELPTPEIDTAATAIDSAPQLTLTKVADDTTDVYEGQMITYTYVAQNVGNVTIVNVSLSDVHSGTNPLGPIALLSTTGTDNGLDNVVDTLAPGQQVTWTSEYVVSATDIDNGLDILNTATATGTPLSGVLVDPTASEILEIGQDVVAVNDSSLNNVVENDALVNIIINDTLSDGTNPLVNEVTVDLDPSTPGIQDSLIVAGEGRYDYDTLTGEVTFTPEAGFTTDPTPINYTLIENATGLDSTATITITYVEEPPVAVDDEDLDNVVGTDVTLNIIENDSLSDGTPIVTPSVVEVDLDPSTPGIQDSLIVAGEGRYDYDTLTGEVTFTPEAGFTTDPTPINYTLIENATGLDSTATITITYVEEPPVAVNDEDLDNVVGTDVTLNIITNDSLSDGTNIVDITYITVDLDPSTPGIQDSLIVAGEGRYDYDTLTGEVTFNPEAGFTTDPTPINYTLIENSTGLDSSAIITITYVEEPPIAVNDSSLNNLFGTTVYLTIVADDSLSDGTLINSLGDITVDIDLSMPGIQNTLNVPGQGDWIYNPVTGDISFEPEVGFNGNPDVITYQLIENLTGLSDTAEIVITYLPEDCILICVPVQVMKVN